MRAAALLVLRTPQAVGLISGSQSFGTTMSKMSRNEYRWHSFSISLFLLFEEKNSYMNLIHRIIPLQMNNE